MAVEEDPTGWLPEPPPPRPAHRDAAIETALRRFDGVDEPAAELNERPRRTWERRHRQQLGVAMSAALLVVIGIPAALIGIRDRTPDAEEASAPAIVRGESDASRPADDQQRAPPASMAEEAERSPPSEASPSGLNAGTTTDQMAAKQRAPGAVAPPPVVAAAPPPPPPPPASAERGADVAQEGQEIITTGSLIRNPDLRSAEKSMAARAPSADTAAPSYPAFLSQLQSAVRANDRRAIIGLVGLPLRVNFRTGPRTYRDARSVERDFERIFTPKVRRAILDQRANRLFTNYQGAMAGDGEVWFDQSCPNPACSPPGPVRIFAINP